MPTNVAPPRMVISSQKRIFFGSPSWMAAYALTIVPADLLERVDGQSVRGHPGRRSEEDALLAADDHPGRCHVRGHPGLRVHPPDRARLRAERRTRRQRAGGAGGEGCAARGHDGSVRLHLLHDDGIPRLPRHVRRDLDGLLVFHEGAAGEVLEAGLWRHRNSRPVLALCRSGVDHPVHHRLPDLSAMETAHKRPNYILIWVYLAVLTAAELALAFELPISRNLKLLLLLFLAVWKAALVGLFFMHLKFERWNLRIMALIPVPLALIFILAGMSEHIW